jgi:hypothetical protein
MTITGRHPTKLSGEPLPANIKKKSPNTMDPTNDVQSHRQRDTTIKKEYIL